MIVWTFHDSSSADLGGEPPEIIQHFLSHWLGLEEL